MQQQPDAATRVVSEWIFTDGERKETARFYGTTFIDELGDALESAREGDSAAWRAAEALRAIGVDVRQGVPWRARIDWFDILRDLVGGPENYDVHDGGSS